MTRKEIVKGLVRCRIHLYCRTSTLSCIYAVVYLRCRRVATLSCTYGVVYLRYRIYVRIESCSFCNQLL